MGSVRRVLPRLAVLGAAAAGAVVLFTIAQAAADDAVPPPPPPDLVGELGGAVTSLVPAEPPALPLPELPILTDAPPPVTEPVPSLTTAFDPILEPAKALLTPSASPALPAGDAAAGLTLPSLPALPAAGAPGSVPTVPTLPGLTELTPPLAGGFEPPRFSVPTLPFDPSNLDAVDLPAVVPSLPDATGLPGSLPVPHPAEPSGSLLRPATAPTATANPGAAGATGPPGGSNLSPSPSTETFTTGGEAVPPDPAAGSGPARAPPHDTPRDPSHRGSTDHASHDYSALPGTDRILVTRGESWHAGTDVEMSITPPEPSVSPD